MRVRAAPTTRAAKDPAARRVELPGKVKRRLGLDEDASWIVLDEFNEFVWPGPAQRLVSRRAPGVWSYGVLPVEVFRAVRDRLRAVQWQRLVVRPG